jgi:hypothetical protein
MNTGCRLRGNLRRLERELPASRGRLEGGAQGGETFPGRAHSSGLYMGPTWSLWEAKCPRVTLPASGPPIRAWNLVGWGVRLPQQDWRVIRAYWRGRSRLTGEPLGVKAGRVGGPG